MNLLMTGDKILRTHFNIAHSVPSKPKELIVSKVSKMFAWATDGKTLTKFKRDTSKGLVKYPKQTNSFRHSGYNYSLPK